MIKEILFLSSNPIKIKTAQRAMDSFGIKVKPVRVSIPEIQASNSAEVALAAVVAGNAQLGVPIMREDHAFHIDALNGFPGAYMAYIEKQISEERLLDMMRKEKNRSSRFELSLAFSDAQGETKEFNHIIPTLIATTARGELSKGWNRVITLVDDKRTLAEYPYEERIDLHTQNYIRLAQFLISNKVK